MNDVVQDILGGWQQAGNVLRVEAEQHWMCLETGLWEGGANEDLIRGSMRKPDGEVSAVFPSNCVFFVLRIAATSYY